MTEIANTSYNTVEDSFPDPSPTFNCAKFSTGSVERGRINKNKNNNGSVYNDI